MTEQRYKLFILKVFSSCSTYIPSRVCSHTDPVKCLTMLPWCHTQHPTPYAPSLPSSYLQSANRLAKLLITLVYNTVKKTISPSLPYPYLELSDMSIHPSTPLDLEMLFSYLIFSSFGIAKTFKL